MLLDSLVQIFNIQNILLLPGLLAALPTHPVQLSIGLAFRPVKVSMFVYYPYYSQGKNVLFAT